MSFANYLFQMQDLLISEIFLDAPNIFNSLNILIMYIFIWLHSLSLLILSCLIIEYLFEEFCF